MYGQQPILVLSKYPTHNMANYLILFRISFICDLPLQAKTQNVTPAGRFNLKI